MFIVIAELDNLRLFAITTEAEVCHGLLSDKDLLDIVLLHCLLILWFLKHPLEIEYCYLILFLEVIVFLR